MIITARFPLGYSATTEAVSGIPDPWPDPWRLFCALVATAGDSHEFDPVLNELETLPPPEIDVPSVRVGMVRSWVEKNGDHEKKDGEYKYGQKSFQVPVPTSVHTQPIRWIWRGHTPGDLVGLQRLCARVAYIGKSESVAVVTASGDDSSGTIVPMRDGRRHVRCPGPGSLAKLRRMYRDGRTISGAGAVLQPYRARTADTDVIELLSAVPLHRIQDLARDIRILAESAGFGDHTFLPIPSLNPHGEQVVKRIRVTGHRSGLAVVALDHEQVMATVIVPGRHDAITSRFVTSARIWETATPVVSRWRDSGSIAGRLAAAGYPAPVRVTTFRHNCFGTGTLPLRFYPGSRYRQDHVVVEFAEPVTGPVQIGLCTGRGFGLFFARR
jgi:hypothetical protein